MKIFTQRELEKYADVLVWGLMTARKGFKKYDTILLISDIAGLPLTELVYERLMKMKFNVITRVGGTPEI